MNPFEIAVVEGHLEITAVVKILRVLQIPTDELLLINKRSCSSFWRDAHKYNEAAIHQLVFGLTDLDQFPCPSGLIAKHLKRGRQTNFVLRIAVRELESWLLADTEAFAKYLKLSPALLPSNPDQEPDPKRTVVNLARRSTRTSIREDLIPEPGSKHPVGRGYTSCMTDFIETHWRPLKAQHRSESLRRAIEAIIAATEMH